jgi:ribosomal protein S12 methylthiotransferase accessory factor YcaO
VGAGAGSAGFSGRAAVLHAFLEALDRTAEVLTDVLELLGAEEINTMMTRKMIRCVVEKPMADSL